MRPDSLYKYCPIYNDDFENERSIENLINSHAVFSNRHNFNDLFDSKINFIQPTRAKLKKLASEMSAKMRFDFKRAHLDGEWENKYLLVEREVSKKIDEYLYYCVTDKPDNNLMWSHYANSHKGFCIEWDSDFINANKVVYGTEIADFDIFDIIKSQYGLPISEDAGDRIWAALRQKLKEWEYESEYRFQISNGMEYLIVKKEKNFALVKYQPEWIKSIIFGCRMTESAKSFLKNNLPFDVPFKEAYEGKSSIEIRIII
jgi:hypothetical protein